MSVQSWAAPIERTDLSSYFSEGAAYQAKVAFDANRYRQSAELLKDEQTLPTRFLRALAAHRLGDFKSSAPQFEALAPEYSQLQDRSFLYAGLGYQKLSDWRGAVRALSQVDVRSRLYSEAQLALAHAKHRLGELDEALSVISSLVTRPPPPWGKDLGAEALLLEADLWGAKKKPKAERDALMRLWSGHPLAKEAEAAAVRLGDRASLPKEVVVTRAESLIDAHRNAQGIALVEPLAAKLKLPDPLACRAHFALGKGYRKLRKHTKAAQVLAPLAKCKDAELKARALFTMGFSQSVAQPELAAATYEQLALLFPEHPLADDALYFAAQAHGQQGERDLAATRLREVAEKYATGDYSAEALFRLFWAARADGQWAQADAYLTEIESTQARNPDSHDVERARYWRGRILEQQANTPQAVTVFEALAREHPTTYYGLLARERVASLDAERSVQLLKGVTADTDAKDLLPVELGPLSEDVQFQSAVELLRMGLGQWVPMDILAIDRSALSPEQVRVLVLVLALSGDQRAAHGLARLWLKSELAGPITAEKRALWATAYPNVYRDLVLEHARSADGLDADLLQAVMREESGLDPQALSWAGAVGLCQLMPATAAGVAASLKLKPPKASELQTPELNVRLGARYLADLLIRARGVKPFALASYNAGETAVARWRREYGDDDLAAWVEQIPLQETRGYVKRVLRSYNTYKLLYAPGTWASTVTPFVAPAAPRATASK